MRAIIAGSRSVTDPAAAVQPVAPPPPPLEALPAGYQLRAGLGVATVLPDLDFETYSDAGFVWTDAGKWTCLPNAPQGKKGLGVVGAAVYAEHPSTEVLSLYYDLKDGLGRRHWRPGLPPPFDLFDHVTRGGLLEAWNSGFEYWIWTKVCVRKYGWPPLPLDQMRCAMAKSRAHALPGKLELAGTVLGIEHGKDAAGTRLLNRLSVPRNPTQGDPRWRIEPAAVARELEAVRLAVAVGEKGAAKALKVLEEDQADIDALYRYNERDIVAEAEISSLVPDLSPEELANWLMDQRINRRGVAADRAGVEACCAIIDQAHARYNAELSALTSGVVKKASEVQKLLGWLAGQGVYADSLDDEAVTGLLAERDKLPAPAVRALQIRATIGSAAVKKAYAMRLQMTAGNRLHDLFMYHAARTGRTTGSGPQPTNMPNSAGFEVMQCESCGAFFGRRKLHCPQCGGDAGFCAHQDEWSPEAVEFAISVMSARSLDLLEYYFDDAMEAVSGCLRGMFVAAPGHDLICSDYSAIEAVVLAFLAGEEWRMEVFRTHGKIYEMSAAKITGIPFEEFMHHAGYNDEELAAPDWYRRKPSIRGSHHPMRKKIGKIAELACFSPDTLVLTDRGYVPIMGVQTTDKLWDGLEWVSHAGVINKGERAVLTLDGVRMTPNHPISTGPSWLAASKLASDPNILARCLENGSANLPLIASLKETAADWLNFGSSVRAGRRRIKSTSATYAEEQQPGATPAPNSLLRAESKSTGLTKTSSLTSTTAVAYLIGWLRQSGVAMTRKIVPMGTTAAEVLRYFKRGATTVKNSFGTSSPCLAGTTQTSTWTGRKLTAATSLEMSDSSRANRTSSTNAASLSYNGGLPTLSDVYDIAHVGPRNRFTIKTASGHLIVHNSGYQGWIGSWIAFGAEAFMTEAEMKKAILAWRAASPAIVEFWGGQERNWQPELFGVEGAFVSATLNPGRRYKCRGIEFYAQAGITYVTLLSGRPLTYHNVRLSPSPRRPGTLSISYEGYNTNPKNGPVGWIRMETWGGRLVENITQATARDLQWYGMRNLEAAGYPIVLHVYDEDVAEVPEGFGSVEEFERIMGAMPHWAADWPVRASGGWRRKRYGK